MTLHCKRTAAVLLALVMMLAFVQSVALASVGPDEEIDMITNILLEGCAEVNEKIGEYATLSLVDQEYDTWDILVSIEQTGKPGRDVYYDIIQTLIDRLNAHSGELMSIAPRNDPTAAITLNGSEVSGIQIVDFVNALGLKNAEGNPFTPDTPIGDLVGQRFIAVINARSGAEYYWVVRFVGAEA